MSTREDEEEVNQRQRIGEWEHKKQKREEVKDVGGCKNETMRELKRVRGREEASWMP